MSAKKNNYPYFKYGLGAAAMTLIALGVLFNSGLFFLLGLVAGYVWAYRLQKQPPKYKPLWYALLLLLVGLVVFISVSDIARLH